MFYKEVINPFIESLANYGTRNAFCINDIFYTYNEFAMSISKIQVALRGLDITGKNIGLVANDDIETYASIFAIWMEGAAYVPLHPQQPVERNMEIISHAELSLVLDSDVKLRFPLVKTIESNKLVSGVVNLLPKNVSDDSPGYMLFTSGSTGKPKGVQITRKNLGAFMKSFWETGIQINQKDRCLQCFDLTFDVSVQSFLVPLTRGACTYTVPHDQIKYSYVFGLLENHQLTFGAMAPSMIRFLRPYFNEINIQSMRCNILTAEASSLELVVEWSKCIPNSEIYDFYGPTEATIYCTYHRFFRNGYNKSLNGMLSIGKPMTGLIAIIIDDEQNILKTKQQGELCISGDQLTPGYWKNIEKNNNSFIYIELDGIVTRFYKTGDSAYFDDEGDIMLAGRLDDQVKIQGYRIELGEIEYHAREFLKGQNAVAIAFKNGMGNTEISLFIEGRICDEQKLIEYFRRKIPSYMIPTKIMSEKVFPLNTNGKIDRIKLKNRLI